MNKKTKSLLLSLLILLAIWGANFIVDQFKGDAADQPIATTVAELTTAQSSAVQQTETTRQSQTSPTESIASEDEVDIDDLVALGLLARVENNGQLVGWRSTAGLFYGMGSKQGNRVAHLFAHLEPDPDKPIHSVFESDKAGLIALIDEAWQKRDGAYSKVQGNGNRIYEVEMGRRIGTAGEQMIRIVVRDGTADLITAYPKQ